MPVREFKHKYTFEEIYRPTYIGRYFTSVVNVNAKDFLAPAGMIKALQNYCAKTNQEVPATHCELLYCVYYSLARCYAQTIAEIEEVTGKKYRKIHVVGGGCQDQFLNALIATETSK